MARKSKQKSQGELVPKLRFPEFRNAPGWEERPLGSVATIHKGKGVSKANLTNDGDQLCIRYGELYTYYGEVIDEVVSRTNVPTDKLALSIKHDVIIPASGETKEDIATASCVMLDDVALGSDLNIIRSDLHGPFFSYYLNGSKRFDIAKVAQGDTVAHLYPGQLEKIDVLFPTPAEQRKIAACLSSLDGLIAAESRKLAALEAHKKGLMQQLFPRPGETQPRLRFPEFRDAPEWDELSLTQIAEFRRGSFPQPYGLPEWYDDKNGKPFVQVYDVDDNFRLKDKTKNRISATAAEQSVFIPSGTLLVTLQGSIGRVAITQYDAYVDRTLLLFQRFVKPVDKTFLAYVIHNLFDIEKRKAPGGIIKTITKEVLSSFEVKLPTLPEQQTIAGCMSSLEEIIAGQDQTLDALVAHKKGLMQQLFPSMEDAHA